MTESRTLVWGATADTALAPHTSEYDRIKEEQRDRIHRRNIAIRETLAGVAAVGWAAVQQNMPVLLLVIPLACFAFGWGYLREDRLIGDIRVYVRTTLKDRVARITGDPDVFGWEFPKADDPRCNQRKWIQLLVDLGVFVGPGTAVCIALSRPWVTDTHNFGAGIKTMIAVATLMTAVLAWQICSASDVRLPSLRRRRRTQS